MSNNGEKFKDLTISEDICNSSKNEKEMDDNLSPPSSSNDKKHIKSIKNSYMPLTPPKKKKISAIAEADNNLPIIPGAINIESLANEVMINIFKFLPRHELDGCALVNRRWNDIIRVHEQNFARRSIDKLSIYADFNPDLITFWACSLASKMQRHFVLDSSDQDDIDGIIQILNYTNVKCLVLGTINLTEANVHLLLSIFQKADVKIMEMQMRRVGLGNITARVFHNYCEQINAKRYGFTEMLQTENDHFGNEFFKKKIFGEAKYFFIKDISANDGRPVPINVEDDVLLDFIFGKNSESVDRKVVSLHFPSISAGFVRKALDRFANERDITHMATEVTLTSCTIQSVLRQPQYQNILLKYSNHVSYNAAADKELQAEIKAHLTGLAFFENVFFSVGERY